MIYIRMIYERSCRLQGLYRDAGFVRVELRASRSRWMPGRSSDMAMSAHAFREIVHPLDPTTLDREDGPDERQVSLGPIGAMRRALKLPFRPWSPRAVQRSGAGRSSGSRWRPLSTRAAPNT